MNLSPAEQLAHSTVRIECELIDGSIGTGTGFFYSLNKTDDQHVPVIVTNKHVIANSKKGRFLLTSRDASGMPQVGSFKSFGNRPQEPKV